MMRKIAWSFVIIASLALAGCSSSSTPNAGTSSNPESGSKTDKIKIGFLVKSATENWFQTEWKLADEAAQKYGFELIKAEVKDAERVQAELDNLGVKGAQGVIICTPDQKLGPAIVSKAKEKNLKLMSVDDRLTGADDKPIMEVPHLGISAYDIGKAVGQALVDEMKKRGWKNEEVGACVVTYDQLETTKQRVQGASEVLVAAGFPEAQLYKVDWGTTTDIPSAKDKAAIILAQHSGVKKWLAFSTNDDGVLGIVRAMEDRQIPAADVIGIGINGESGLDDLMKAQPTGFFASMLLDKRKHGFGPAEMMFKWVKDGVEPPKETWTVGTLITRDNYQKVFQEQGLELPKK